MADEEMLLREKLDLLLRTGCLLVESLADTPRVMRNLRRVAAFMGLPEENLHLYVNYNILMVNLSDDHHSYTKFQRCDHHRVNMTAISAISKLSWKAIRDNYTLSEYSEKLKEISQRKNNFSPWAVAAGGGFACGGFCIQFGCDWPAFFYVSVVAMLSSRLRMYLNGRNLNEYIGIGIVSFVATLLAWLTSFISCSPLASLLPAFMVSATPWHPLLACALFIVPGVPLINFVSDMLDGHIQVGVTRAVKILMILTAMAFGIALAIKLCGIDNFARDLSITPHHEYWEFAVASAISAMGFSMIFNIPRRLLPVVAVGGIIAVCTRNFVSLGASSHNVGLDMGPAVGSLVGSALVSIICTWAIHKFHTPHHCLSIPSVIPMIPGVLMYRSLFALINMRGIVGEVTTVMHNGIMASMLTLFIALGVAIPNIFFRKMINPSRERKLFKMLVERKRKRGEFVDLEEMS